MSEQKRRILVADDDDAVREVMVRLLSEDYEVITAPSGVEAMEFLEGPEPPPDLVILDVRMPGIDGYQVCARMQEREELAWIPVVFVTILESDENQRRAFAAGAAAYIRKPFDREELLNVVAEHVGTGERWSSLKDGGPSRQRSWLLPSTFVAFRRYLLEQRDASPAQTAAVEKVGPENVYAMAGDLRLSEEQLSRYLARFLELPYRERINGDELSLSKLPRTFCATNDVLVLKDGSVAVANPFNWELMDVLERTVWRGREPRIAVTSPDRIRQLCDVGGATQEEEQDDRRGADIERSINIEDRGAAGKVEGFEIQALANEILRGAIADRASDVHVEPKERTVLVRYRIDGDMHDIRTLSGPQGARLISRLKALAGMDIAERRRPQDGSLAMTMGEREFKLRLATSSTRHGETVVVRLLEPDQEAISLERLGFSPTQGKALRAFMARTQGLVLVVGPTGCGKSTTIFSLLSTSVDGRSRSIMTVEDPVEYRIPHANQQEVNTRAGVNFDTLLRSAMRQDPDILLLGEVRDPFSANAAMEFASSGHLTVSTLHSSNATTSVFRLERLGVQRGAMADAISGIVAQKLLKTLCPECRDVGPPTDEEEAMLAGFVDDLPERVARPVGCPACRETGYRGREVAAEILPFDRDIARMVREGASIAEIRMFCTERGDAMIGNHALEKVRALKFSVQDVYEQVLVEEWAFGSGARSEELEQPVETGSAKESEGKPSPRERARREKRAELDERKTAAAGVDGDLPAGLRAPPGSPQILVVDDDPDVRTLLDLHLTNAGYAVVTAADGVEALIEIGRREFDAVLSDIRMPNLDGEKLMEMMGQKALDVPALFLTGVEDEKLEGRLLAFGALDYIRKPVRKEVLLMRLRNAVLKGRKGKDDE